MARLNKVEITNIDHSLLQTYFLEILVLFGIERLGGKWTTTYGDVI